MLETKGFFLNFLLILQFLGLNLKIFELREGAASRRSVVETCGLNGQTRLESPFTMPPSARNIFFEYLVDFKARRPHLKPELYFFRTFPLTVRPRRVGSTRGLDRRVQEVSLFDLRPCAKQTDFF